MKVMLAYDGSECANVAIDNLRIAGFPETGDMVVTCVTDFGANLREVAAVTAPGGCQFPHDAGVKAVEQHPDMEAQAIADLGIERAKRILPAWRFTSDPAVDLLPTGLLRQVDQWKPDLLVLGPHGRHGWKRRVLGSVSRYALHHAHCSVRICRQSTTAGSSSPRLLLATDGSPFAAHAVDWVAKRHWPAHTAVRVVTVVNTSTWLMAAAVTPPGSLCMPEVEDELQREACGAAHAAKQILVAAGLDVETQIRRGEPAAIIAEESVQWGADCIFMGAHGRSTVGRAVLGSVSSSVAESARCTVEVVRAVAV